MHLFFNDFRGRAPGPTLSCWIFHTPIPSVRYYTGLYHYFGPISVHCKKQLAYFRLTILPKELSTIIIDVLLVYQRTIKKDVSWKSVHLLDRSVSANLLKQLQRNNTAGYQRNPILCYFVIYLLTLFASLPFIYYSLYSCFFASVFSFDDGYEMKQLTRM